MQSPESIRHFKHQYSRVAFPPPREIKYAVYSKNIWERFLEQLPEKNSRIVDLGCGGGTVLHNLEKLGYRNLFGIDFVEAIPPGFLRYSKFALGQAVNTGAENNSFDGLVATMVIEHVDDKKMVEEISRILKNGGVALVTSILKSSRAWYFHRNKFGERVVEPTHVREYKSRKEFEELFLKNFEIVKTDISCLRYPLLDPIYKLMASLAKSELLRKAPTRNFLLGKLRSVRVPIPGYFVVETLVRKK